MKGPGFLGRLFGRKRTEEAPSLTLEEILGRAFGSAEPGSGQAVTVEAVELEALEAELRTVASGVTSALSTGRDESELVILYPDSFLKRAGKPVAAAPGAAQPDPVRDLIVSTEAAVLRLLALVPPPSDEEEPGLERDIEVRPIIRTLKRYREADRDELMWGIADCVAWKARVGQATFHLFLASVLRDSMVAALKGMPAYERAVRDRVLAASGGPDAAPPAAATTLAVGHPAELVAGSLFLPPRVACGNHVIQLRWSGASLGAAPARSAVAAAVWFEAGFLLGGKPFSARYAFEVGSPQKAAPLAQTLKQLMACELREAARIAATLAAGVAVEKPHIAPSVAPEGAARAGCLVLRGTLAVGTLRLPCEVWVPGRSLALLCATAMDPWDYRQVQAEKPPLLVALLSLNQGLLRKSVGRLHLEYLETRTGQPSKAPAFFPFAAFLELAPDRDARLALQNQVLQKIDPHPLRALFSYTETVKTPDGKQVTRTATPFAVDENRLVGFLPRTDAEQWRDATPLPDRATYLELNREIMRSIRAAARRKQLLLSRRSSFILDRLYYPTVQAESRAKLDALIKARTPFADIEKLPKPRIQELLSRQPARTVALALVGADGELALVQANTSKAKGDQLAEDFALLKRRLDEGTVDLDEALDAKAALSAETKRILEADAEQAARGLAKGQSKGPAQAGAAGRPRLTPPRR